MGFEYDITNVDTDRLAYTGFNGWVNFDLKKFHFCGRCSHLEWTKEVRYYDGTVETPLEGMHGNPYDTYENGGAKVREFGSAELYDIYYWAAIKFGWYQFINHDVTPDLMDIKLQFMGPVHSGGREFATLWNAKSYTFKSNHRWPDKSVRVTDEQMRKIQTPPKIHTLRH